MNNLILLLIILLIIIFFRYLTNRLKNNTIEYSKIFSKIPIEHNDTKTYNYILLDPINDKEVSYIGESKNYTTNDIDSVIGGIYL